MSFDIEKIKSLIAVAAEAQVDELELSQNGVDVRIQRFADVVDAADLEKVPVAAVQTLPVVQQAPGGGALVNAGDSIDAGTVVGVLEAMKIMNEIESEAQGRIKRVLCDNGELVSAGQPLFEIEEA